MYGQSMYIVTAMNSTETNKINICIREMIELGTWCMLQLHIPNQTNKWCWWWGGVGSLQSNSSSEEEVCFPLWLQFKWQNTIVIDVNAAKRENVLAVALNAIEIRADRHHQLHQRHIHRRRRCSCWWRILAILYMWMRIVRLNYSKVDISICGFWAIGSSHSIPSIDNTTTQYQRGWDTLTLGWSEPARSPHLCVCLWRCH